MSTPMKMRRGKPYIPASFWSGGPVRTTVVIRGREAIHDLFAMTPYYWKTPADGAKRLGGLESLFTELGFDLLLYRRTEESE